MHKLIKLLAVTLMIAGCSAEKDYNTVIITQDGHEVKYLLETALTQQQQAQGLMNRTSLDENGGMIFAINPIRNVAMWMKATQIPLDIIFVSPEGTVVNIAENAKPMSEDHIMSAKPVRAVIEINGGQAQKHNIKIGDKVKNTLLGNMPTKIIRNPETASSLMKEPPVKKLPEKSSDK